jgi:hypothetical protein
VTKRLREELAKLQVEINDEKSPTVDLERGENFGWRASPAGQTIDADTDSAGTSGVAGVGVDSCGTATS